MSDQKHLRELHIISSSTRVVIAFDETWEHQEYNHDTELHYLLVFETHHVDYYVLGNLQIAGELSRLWAASSRAELTGAEATVAVRER